MISKGVSVPRPTDSVLSSRPTPGYRSASVKLRMLGDGLVHGSPVWSSHKSRRQFCSGITVRSALEFRSALNILANSPMVMP